MVLHETCQRFRYAKTVCISGWTRMVRPSMETDEGCRTYPCTVWWFPFLGLQIDYRDSPSPRPHKYETNVYRSLNRYDYYWRSCLSWYGWWLTSNVLYWCCVFFLHFGPNAVVVEALGHAPWRDEQTCKCLLHWWLYSRRDWEIHPLGSNWATGPRYEHLPWLRILQ